MPLNDEISINVIWSRQSVNMAHGTYLPTASISSSPSFFKGCNSCQRRAQCVNNDSFPNISPFIFVSLTGREIDREWSTGRRSLCSSRFCLLNLITFPLLIRNVCPREAKQRPVLRDF